MKPLPEQFEKKGFNHRLERRSGRVAVYQRHKGNQPHHWEVIIIREQKERVMQTPSGEITLPHQEVYPSSEKWGQLGWTFTDYSDALAKFNTMTTP